MRKSLLLIALLLASPALGHTLFLEFADHVLRPGAEASVALVNGEFGSSDNVIERDRMTDVSIVGPDGERVHPELSDWRDEGTTSWLDFETGEAGTYLLGVSTKARVIELDAEAFHSYLTHDGVTDVLEARERDGLLDQPARERYSKHVKSVFRAGEPGSDAYGTVLGYPIEIVPLADAADLRAGDSLPVRVLLNGAPLSSQLVYASHAAHHAHDASGGHIESFSGRTDAEGRVDVPVDEAGRWYIRLIHMAPAPETDLDYESLWATLTFQVGEAPSSSPSVLLIIGAAALILAGVTVLAARATRSD